METKTYKKKQKQRSVQDHKATVNIPYVEGVSEAVTRVYKRYGVSTTMRPHTTTRNLLVHPKDKVNTEETAKCVYRIPCKNCQKVYITETGRSLGVHTKEHPKVDQQEGHKYTRSTKRQSESEQNKSSTQKIMLSTETRQQSSLVSLIELHGGSERLSRFGKRAKVSLIETTALTS